MDNQTIQQTIRRFVSDPVYIGCGMDQFAHVPKNPRGISRRDFIGLGAGALAAAAGLVRAGESPGRSWNVVYIHSHDTGRWISPYGYPVPTLALESFASRATTFRNHQTVSPTCSPSRGCLLTGSLPHKNGLIGLAHRGFAFSHPEWHAANLFSHAGYRTVLSGIQHETTHKGDDIMALGYSEIITGPVNGLDGPARDRQAAQNASEFLRSPSSRERPFFLSVGFFNTHRPFPRSAPTGEERPMTGIPDNPATRGDMADYLESARVLDECFGAVMEALHRGGHGDNTIIFFTTDHGPAFPGMKCTLREDGTNVALIMDYPGNPSRGKLNDALVANTDVMPTVFDLLGWEMPPHFSGVSLLPLMEEKADSVRDEVFYSINFHTVYEPVRALRRRRHKLIRHFRPGTVCLDNIDPGPTKTWMVDHGLAEMPVPEYELYDLECDAGETKNLALDSKFSDLLGSMKSRLEEIMVETRDPLLKGEIPAPSGAVLGMKET